MAQFVKHDPFGKAGPAVQRQPKTNLAETRHGSPKARPAHLFDRRPYRCEKQQVFEHKPVRYPARQRSVLLHSAVSNQSDRTIKSYHPSPAASYSEAQRLSNGLAGCETDSRVAVSRDAALTPCHEHRYIGRRIATGAARP